MQANTLFKDTGQINAPFIGRNYLNNHRFTHISTLSPRFLEPPQNAAFDKIPPLQMVTEHNFLRMTSPSKKFEIGFDWVCFGFEGWLRGWNWLCFGFELGLPATKLGG